MSKVVPKQEKVTIEEDKSTKVFENAPKLFSKWSYDDIKVLSTTLRLKIPASSTTSLPSRSSLKSSFPTLLEDTRVKNSEKLSAPSSRDSSAQCSSTDATLVRKSKPSVSSGTPSKLFTSSLPETLCRFSLVPCFNPAPEKIRPESVLVVLSESRPSTCLHWEESTRPSTWSLRDPGSTQSRPTRLLLSVWLTKSSTPRKATFSPAMLWKRRNKSKKLLRATVDCCLPYYNFLKTINSYLFYHSSSINHTLYGRSLQSLKDHRKTHPRLEVHLIQGQMARILHQSKHLGTSQTSQNCAEPHRLIWIQK